VPKIRYFAPTKIMGRQENCIVHVKPGALMRQKLNLNIHTEAWNNGITVAGISC